MPELLFFFILIVLFSAAVVYMARVMWNEVRRYFTVVTWTPASWLDLAIPGVILAVCMVILYGSIIGFFRQF